MITKTGRCVAVKVMAAGLVLMLAGCDSSEVTIKNEVTSPDGFLTARVQTHAYYGPGNNAMFTEVYLFWSRQRKILTKDHREPTEILTLSAPHDKFAPVKVAWRSNKALEIVHHPETKVVFQVIKAYGVDISLR